MINYLKFSAYRAVQKTARKLSFALLCLSCVCSCAGLAAKDGLQSAPRLSRCVQAGETSPLPGHTELSAQSLIEKGFTGVDKYKITGGEWVDGLPVLVNEEFNMGMAMGVPTAGPAIAAGLRRKNNREKAAQLTNLVVEPRVWAKLDELRSCGINAYAVLWGADQTALLVVFDRIRPLDEGSCEVVSSDVFVAEGKRPLVGEGSWAEDGFAAFNDEFLRLLQSQL